MIPQESPQSDRSLLIGGVLLVVGIIVLSISQAYLVKALFLALE